MIDASVVFLFPIFVWKFNKMNYQLINPPFINRHLMDHLLQDDPLISVDMVWTAAMCGITAHTCW